jgi:pimeloyl-ACP methyl ester carboxylesterase
MLPLGSSRCAIFVRAPEGYRNPNADVNREVTIFVPGIPIGSWEGLRDVVKHITACRGDCIFLVRQQITGVGGGPPLPIVSATRHGTSVAAGQIDPWLGTALEPGVKQLAVLLHHLGKQGVGCHILAYSEGGSITTVMGQRYTEIIRSHTGKPVPSGEVALPMVKDVTYIGAGVALVPEFFGDRYASYRFAGDFVNGFAEFGATVNSFGLPFSGTNLGYTHRNTSNTGPPKGCILFPWGVHRMRTGIVLASADPK